MKWERSKNRHGLWDGINRLGYIGLAIRGSSRRYYWFIDISPWSDGFADTLGEARKFIVDGLKARGVEGFETLTERHDEP